MFSEHQERASEQSLFLKHWITFFASTKISVSTRSCNARRKTFNHILTWLKSITRIDSVLGCHLTRPALVLCHNKMNEACSPPRCDPHECCSTLIVFPCLQAAAFLSGLIVLYFFELLIAHTCCSRQAARALRHALI